MLCDVMLLRCRGRYGRVIAPSSALIAFKGDNTMELIWKKADTVRYDKARGCGVYDIFLPALIRVRDGREIRYYYISCNIGVQQLVGKRGKLLGLNVWGVYYSIPDGLTIVGIYSRDGRIFLKWYL